MRAAIFLVILACLSSLAGHCQTPKKYAGDDLRALNQVATKWGHYWNTHNMDSMGTLLRPDVDFITVGGTWLKGRAEAAANHKEKHATIFKTSIWTTNKVDIKYMKSDLAIIHLQWGITGDFDPNGTPRVPRQGIFTWVVTKEKAQWLLLAVHNVNIREPSAWWPASKVARCRCASRTNNPPRLEATKSPASY